MKKFIVILQIFMTCFKVNSQSFFKNTTHRALTLKEMQLQFDFFKKTNNLSQKKHWKFYKRFESELALHTNGSGEPGDPTAYFEAAIDMANQKQQLLSSAPWFPVGPNALPANQTGYMENGIARVNCVAFHPTNANTFFVGVAQGGVWKTTNGGTSYTPLTDNLPITRISDICIDPTSPNTMYLSVCDFEYVGIGLHYNGKKRNTHFGLGVYKTTDGGTTWNATGLTFSLTSGDASLIRKIIINPANTNELLACGVSGMYKSTNGGASWSHSLDSLFWDMVQDPVNPNIIYAATGWIATANDGYANIYKSTNFGATWTLLNTGIPTQGSVQRIKLAIAPSDNNYVYALCCNNSSGFYGIYQSTNAGSTWTYKPPITNILEAGTGSGSGGQGTYDLALLVDATNKNQIHTGGINLWGSTDGGTTFNPSSHWTLSYGATLHGDIHFIARQPATNSIFVCSDGGIYKTNALQIDTWSGNWTTNWTKLNDGMQVTSFYRLSSSKTSQGRLVAGAQDNASIYYDGSSWSTIFGGDGMDNYLDPLNNQDIIGSSQYGTIYYSNNNGASGTVVGSNPSSESSEWVTPIVADYNHPGIVYAGNENVVKSTNGGQTWNVLGTIYTNTNTLQNTEISALAVSNTNSNVIYAARRVRYEYGLNGIVFKSTNGGASFTNITNNLPDTLYYTGIDINETNSNEVVICMAGFTGGCKVFKTTNGGSTWTNISYNLPNLPVNNIKYVPGSNQLMIATDIGVYILNPSATNWINYSFGLPNVIVTDIEFNSALNKVYVSTFGRGIWESSLSTITSIKQNNALSTLEFNVYPNINHGEFTVDFPETINNNQLQIIDIMGRIVYTAQINQTKINIKLNVPTGTYYVKLNNKSNLGVKKIVVE